MREKLETLSLSVLREFAKDKKIKNISSLRKADLIDAILKAQEEEDKQKKEFKDSRPVQKKTVVKPEGHTHVEETGAQADTQNPQATGAGSASAAGTGSTSATGAGSASAAGTGSPQNPSEPKPQRPLEYADGILEVLSEGYGFIRCENFLPGDNDVYVSPSQIRKFNLKTGDIVRGPKRQKTKDEKFSALMYLESVNGFDPMAATRRPSFETLTPVFPNDRIHLEKNSNTLAMRMVDLIYPIGKG